MQLEADKGRSPQSAPSFLWIFLPLKPKVNNPLNGIGREGNNAYEFLSASLSNATFSVNGEFYSIATLRGEG